MARTKDRERALGLRKKGMSYSQIKKRLGVAKSTLSYWLRDYPLSEKRIRELQGQNEQRIERCRETKREKKEKRLKEFYEQQKKLIFPTSERELYLAGLFLYWGDGTKSHPTSLSLSNSDPAMLNFFIAWLTKSLKIPKKKLRVQLHLYQNMDINEEIKFWSKTLCLPQNQFYNPYIKKTSFKRINHKGSFGHGTCNVNTGSARLKEKILMALRAIGDQYL